MSTPVCSIRTLNILDITDPNSSFINRYKNMHQESEFNWYFATNIERFVFVLKKNYQNLMIDILD